MAHPAQEDPIIDFDDFDDDPDDSAAVDAYAAELQAAVEALGVTVLEPGQRNEEL
jgi:hypothetical protein